MIKPALLVAAALAAVALAPGPAPAQNPGNEISALTAPTLVVHGRSVAITGFLTGPDVNFVRIDLQRDEYPFGEFEQKDGPGMTEADGSFKLSGEPTVLTRYRAIATTRGNVTSPVIEVQVGSEVLFNVSTQSVRRGRFVRLYGQVKPGAPGAQVSIERRKLGGASYAQVATAELGPDAKFSRRLRVRSTGSYRVRIAGDDMNAAGLSRTRAIRAR
jgi:hypothetical protein